MFGRGLTLVIQAKGADGGRKIHFFQTENGDQKGVQCPQHNVVNDHLGRGVLFYISIAYQTLPAIRESYGGGNFLTQNFFLKRIT